MPAGFDRIDQIAIALGGGGGGAPADPEGTRAHAADRYPALIYFPGLPPVRLCDGAVMLNVGHWRIGTPPETVPWRTERFRELSTALVASMARLYGPGSFVWHAARGFDGVLPNEDDLSSLELAVTFGLLDRNDSINRGRDGDLNAGHYLGTSENGRLMVQPIDVAQGFITHSRGGALRPVMDGGHRIGEAAPPFAEALVPIRNTVFLSSNLVNAMHDRLRRHRTSSEHIRLAAEWHASALQNARAVTAQQRFIALKTGFEALTGESNSRECARDLRALFEKATSRHRNLLPWNGLLWSPHERDDIFRPWRRGNRRVVDRRTDLEDWFMHFAALRNDIIHDGVVGNVDYRSPRRTLRADRKRYDGNMFWVAERVLRESIKARLGAEVLLCGRIRQQRVHEAAVAMLRAAIHSNEQDESADVSPPPIGRSVAELLVLLRANQPSDAMVGLRPFGVPESDAWEDLDEEADVFHGLSPTTPRWFARSDTVEIPVTQTEAIELTHAGAVMEDSGHLTPCE